MSVQIAQERAANAIVSNARVQARLIVEEAEADAARIISGAHRHATRIEETAREYAAKLNPEKPRIDSDLYKRVMHERYPVRRHL